jgi:hypothetical protein
VVVVVVGAGSGVGDGRSSTAVVVVVRAIGGVVRAVLSVIGVVVDDVVGGALGAATTCGPTVVAGRADLVICSVRSLSKNCSSCSRVPSATSLWYSFSTSSVPVGCLAGAELANAQIEKPAARPAAETAPKNHRETIDPPSITDRLWVVPGFAV